MTVHLRNIFWSLFCYLILTNFVSAFEVENNMAINNSFFFELVDNTHTKIVKESDPIYKKLLSRYRAFYVEGENLKRYCDSPVKTIYSSRFEADAVTNSIVATLQMIILKNTIEAIDVYSRELELTDIEYESMYDKLIKSSCSQNISVIGHRRIRKMFMDIHNKSHYQLPSIANNPFYTETVMKKQSIQEKLGREFYYTIGLFKSACSWGQDFQSLRGLRSLIQNPVVAAYIIREMMGLEVALDENSISKGLTEAQTTKVHCDGIICREKDEKSFFKSFPRALGSQSMMNDLKTMYCENILGNKKDLEGDIDISLSSIYDPYLGNESKRLIGQFLALITKIPDFNVWTDNPTYLRDYMKYGIINYWDEWSKYVAQHLIDNNSYEEPLKLQVVPMEIFLDKTKIAPKVILDLNSGEFDESVAINGKIKFKFQIEVLDRDLVWLYFRYQQTLPTEKEEIEKFDKLLRAYVEKNYKKIEDEFSSYLISGDLISLISQEIKAQLIYIKADDYKIENKMIKIPIEVNISPFALIYLKNKRIMEEALQEEIAKNKQFKSLKRVQDMALENK